MPLTRQELNEIYRDIGEATVSKPLSDELIENTLEKYLHPSFKALELIQKMFFDGAITEEHFLLCQSCLVECNKELQGE